MCRYIPGIMKNFIVVNGLIENECHCEPETIIEQRYWRKFELRGFIDHYTQFYCWKLNNVRERKNINRRRLPQKSSRESPVDRGIQVHALTNLHPPPGQTEAGLIFYLHVKSRDMIISCKLLMVKFLMVKRNVTKRDINPPPPLPLPVSYLLLDIVRDGVRLEQEGVCRLIYIGYNCILKREKN